MISLDTNVLARLLLADDAAQLARVNALFSKKETFTAPVTVLLELVWVLEAYENSVEEIVTGLNLLFALPNFRPAHFHELRTALGWFSEGMDFADAVHLALSADSKEMLSFDRKFVKLSKKLSPEIRLSEVPP